MNADIPGPAARAAERVRESADLEMALQDEDAPLPQLGHDARERQSTHTGTNDNRIVFGPRGHAVTSFFTRLCSS